MAFKFNQLSIPGVILIESQSWNDQRGNFMELYKLSEFSAFGISDNFVQENYSYSIKGVLRGLHQQITPKPQAKLVKCIRGEIFDVAVDLRDNSPTYGNWVGVNLSAENKKQLFIPQGFLHGFCVLSDEAEVIYKCSVEYAPECERGIVWNDPTININWPIRNPIVADKDLRLPLLKDFEKSK